MVLKNGHLRSFGIYLCNGFSIVRRGQLDSQRRQETVDAIDGIFWIRRLLAVRLKQDDR